MMAILIDPDAFGMADDFAADMDRYTAWVKASPPAPGVEAVQFPGDPERRCAQERQRDGIPVDQGTWAQLLDVAKAVGVPQDRLDVFAAG